MMGGDPYVTAQQVRDICGRLDRIAEALEQSYLVQAAAAAQREEDRAAWWEAFLVVLGIEIGGSTDEDVHYACRAADAALAARKSRWPEPQKEGEQDD
jgi:hypothetical protein